MEVQTNANIAKVIETGMCTGCGICESLCPKRAIDLKLSARGLVEPVVDESLCTHCSHCLKVCGRFELDYAQLRDSAFSLGTFHPLLGQAMAYYRGHAADSDLRRRATSGGTITALLKLAFEMGMVDTAVVTGSDPSDPLKTKPFVAHSVEQVLQVCGSRYAPSPVNRCIRDAIVSDKVAVVGLPCHFESLRKAEAVHKDLKRRVVLRLGLFCSHNVSYMGTEFVRRRLRIPREEIFSFRYRGDGWPSGIHVKTRDGSEYHVPNLGSFWMEMFSSFAFSPPYCFLCMDQTSELADLSFGDAWLPEVLDEDQLGESLLIVRSPVGAQLIREAVERHVLELSELSPNRIVESQRWPLYFKKRLVSAKYELLAARRFDTGGTALGDPDLTQVDHWLAYRAWRNAVHSCDPWVFALLCCLPMSLVRTLFRYYSTRLWHESSAWAVEGEV